MKIALCLNGYFSNAGGTFDAVKGHSYIHNKLFSRYDVDTFIHSWDVDNKEEILNLYNPVLAEFEKQRKFTDELSNVNQEYFFKDGTYHNNTMFKTFSVSYSRKMSVALKKQHEMQNNFKYDCVVMARYDLGQRGKEHRQKYYATNFNFNHNLDMSYVYSAFWDQLNHGFADHWFFSNSENMDILSCLHDKLTKYYQPSSEYVKKVTEGWPDSNSYNEFSNEFFNPIKSNNLKAWPLNACIDNHKLYKWYLIDSGLYDICKFIDITEDR